MKWTRVEDTMEFARRMNLVRLGVACCVGLAEEGRVLTDILECNGFQVTFGFCKTGGVPKEELGLKDNEKVHRARFLFSEFKRQLSFGLCLKRSKPWNNKPLSHDS